MISWDKFRKHKMINLLPTRTQNQIFASDNNHRIRLGFKVAYEAALRKMFSICI